ncbi:hypothetical protein XENORESO_009796 [Xenotaenia resolanae]|uniref:Uncharacterized protein n=1 Tax=Xenotaenia resolanae TaxID=208358 RepID=A0ABV0VYR8_9TELE
MYISTSCKCIHNLFSQTGWRTPVKINKCCQDRGKYPHVMMLLPLPCFTMGMVISGHIHVSATLCLECRLKVSILVSSDRSTFSHMFSVSLTWIVTNILWLSLNNGVLLTNLS